MNTPVTNLTYGELLETLRTLTPEQMRMNVTVYVRDTDEFYPARSIRITTDTDTLDANHPYIVISY